MKWTTTKAIKAVTGYAALEMFLKDFHSYNMRLSPTDVINEVCFSGRLRVGMVPVNCMRSSGWSSVLGP